MMMSKVQKAVNPHFDNFLFNWDYKFYLLVGGYGSSKSYHIALKLIMKMIEEKRTALVVRQVYDTHRDSTFSLLQEIVGSLGLGNKIKCVTSPMQIRFPNGSKIIFKGMDKVDKLKSINDVSLIWVEECSEINYDGFKELLGRLRHPSLELHMILSTNPVGESNWSYKHFFYDKTNKRLTLDDKELYKNRTMVVGNTYYHHSTAEDNYFLPESYIEQLEEMKEYDPDLYRIAREGRFGINGIKVLPQFKVKTHEGVMEDIAKIRKPLNRSGMDFGFVTSYNALLRMTVDTEKQYLYIYWEYYKNGMTDDETAADLEEFRRSGERINADSAEPKTIQYYRKLGFNMYGAHKFQGSRLQNTKKVKRFKKIICSDACPNTINELEDLVYAKDRNGDIIEDDFEIDPHTFSAIWYGLDGYEVVDLKDEAKHEARPAPQRPKGRRAS